MADPQAKPRRLIRLPEVLERVGLSVPTIYRGMAEGWFPLSVALGPNARAWVEDEIDGWQDAKINARDNGEDAELRLVNPHIGRGRPRKAQARRVA